MAAGRQLTSRRRDESAQQIVLYSEAERRLQVLSSDSSVVAAPVAVAQPSPPLFCNQCGQPWPDFSARPFERRGDETHGATRAASFMDRNYFRLLDMTSRRPVALPSAHSDGSSARPHGSKQSVPPPLQGDDDGEEEEEDGDFVAARNLSENSFNQGYYRRFFREEERLGRGAGGAVYKCQHLLDGIELGAYAVKKVPVGDDHAWLSRMLQEVHILENLRHPHIVEYKHAWLEYHRLTPFGPSIPCLFILMQLATGGNLEEYTLMGQQNSRNSHDLREICRLFVQICRGLAHLHRCGIIHRDLKPSNILLQHQEDGQLSALITDFGECVQGTDGPVGSGNRTGATGTIEFVAPELLKRKTSGDECVAEAKLLIFVPFCDTSRPLVVSCNFPPRHPLLTPA